MKDPRYQFALDLETEIGGYRIEKVLGAGGFGITYRGYNDITQKHVAIKEFYVRDISTREGQTVVVDTEVDEGTYEYALKKFQEEAQAVVTRFAHPYIIRGENFLRTHNTCYMIMEYVDGKNLEEWLTARHLPPSEAEIRPMFEKLFDAVDYVHQQNTMHRDLTPRNIMIRSNGDPVLIDFGAAGLGIDLGRSSKIVAQLRYAPPEQTDDTGAGIHGRYTDIFSLGGVLFRTVTGRTPMAPMSRLARLGTQRGDGVDPQQPVAQLVADLSAYSERFLAGVDQALQLDQRRRPQTIGEFRRALGWSADQLVIPRVTSLVAPKEVSDDQTQIFVPPAPPPTPPDATTGSGGRSGPSAIRNRQPPEAPRQVQSRHEPVRRPPPEERRSGGGAGVVLVVLLVLGGGGGLGTWLAWPAITDMIQQLNGPEAVAPFTFKADVNGRYITLTGYAPSPEDRTAIVSAITAATPDAIVDNRLRIARGAPKQFLALVKSVTGRLGDVSQGQISVVDETLSLDVAAANTASYTALRRDFETTVKNAGKGTFKVDLPTVRPYQFAVRTGNGTVSMTGYVPSAAARDAIRAALSRALPGVRIDDKTELALGAITGFEAAVPFLIARLNGLNDASLTLGEDGLRLEGTPKTPALYEQAATLDQATVPGGVPVALAIKLPTVAPYQWSLTTDGASVVARGFMPSAELRRALADAVARAVPGLPFKDETVLADGAPVDFAQAIDLFAEQLKLIQRGRFALNGDTASVEGMPRTPEEFPLIERAVRNGLPTAIKLGQTSIEAPKVSPYLFAVTVADGTLKLTGYVPNETTRREIAAIAAQVAPGLPLVDNLQIADGAPDGFAATVRFALQQAGRMASGTVSIHDAQLTVDGLALNLDVYKVLKDQVRTAVPRGATLDKPQIRLRTDVGAQECDHLALPVDSADRPAGEPGVDLANIDAPRAIEACRQARATYPNVSRFATALGYAYQKAKQFPEAIREYRAAVEAEDASAMALLAGLARDGSGMPQDYALAFDLFTRSANLGNASANFALGAMFENGLGRPKDAAKAAPFYQKAANLGSADAFAQLGWLAQNGLLRGVPDYPRAYEAYENGARLGSAFAMHQLGVMNQQGLNPARVPNPAKAFEWYSRAAERGRVDSMAALGAIYLDGIGRPADYAKAAQWLEKAAAAGDAGAMLNLGRVAFEGLGRPKDPVAAASWFEKAAAAGKTQAYAKLGLLFQTGAGPTAKPDYVQAYEWNLKGTKVNDPLSFYQIGTLFENGQGRPVDFKQAIENYQRAGDLGHAPSFHQLGFLAEIGRGKPVDYAKAVDYYKRAANLGYAPSMVQLGLLSQSGSGTPKDDGAALLWFTKAVQLGNPAAFWHAAVLTDAGRGGQKNPDRVAQYLLKAYAAREPRTVEALSGDLASFSVESRVALQKALQQRGLLQKPALDGTYDAETKRAALAYTGDLTN